MAMEKNKKAASDVVCESKVPSAGKSLHEGAFPDHARKPNYPLLLGKRLDVIQDALSSCLCHYMPCRDCSLNMSQRIGAVCDFIRARHHVCVVAQTLLCSL